MYNNDYICLARHHISVGGRCVSTTSVMTTRGIEDVFIATDQIDGNVLEHLVCECIGDEAYNVMYNVSFIHSSYSKNSREMQVRETERWS